MMHVPRLGPIVDFHCPSEAFVLARSSALLQCPDKADPLSHLSAPWQHPGGESVLYDEEIAGQDATETFL